MPPVQITRTTPWLTPGAINFLQDFCKENPKAKILEFGSGASTIWFAKQGMNLTSIEHDIHWYSAVSLQLQNIDTNHISYILHPRPYSIVCNRFADKYFDLILVDGRDRVACVKSSISLLKSGGILMLDNAERRRYREIYQILKSWKIIRTTHTGLWQTNWWVKP